MRVDVAVIGAGILGCTMARQLARYRLDVAVVEAAHDVAEGTTKANSGIIHTGFHPRGGSLKGTSCVQGNARSTISRTSGTARARTAPASSSSCRGTRLAPSSRGFPSA